MKSRREFFELAAGLALAARTGSAQQDLEEIGIAELQQWMTVNGVRSINLTHDYFARMERFDRDGPKLASVIELNSDATAIGQGLDMERAQKGSRGPLHGIPILIKDNIDTADRMATSAGSRALAGSAGKDAVLVARLRAAGAILLGKTNLSEWANFRSSHSVSGWSGRGGQTRNPYATDRSPSGSSSGTAVAVSACFCAAGVGTETDGSIVSPASINGIVGIKPTVGLIPGAGIVPISHRQDTAGPMARTVADAALLLGVMAGASYGQALDPNGLKGARIGVARDMFGFHDQVDKLMETAIDTIKKLGAEVIDPANIPTRSKLSELESEALLYEFKADLNQYLQARNGSVKSLKDVIAFNEENAKSEMPYFGQDQMIKAEAKGPLSSRAYQELVSRLNRLAKQEGIDAVMAKFKLDAIIAPTDGPAWPIDYVDGDHFTGGASTPAAVAGYPHITVPMGFVFGLPVGISFFGSPRTEVKLIKYGFAFEQATKARKPPRFLSTVNLTV
jgi:amidase